MIVCSCTVISDRDIEGALLEISNAPERANPDTRRRLSSPQASA